MELQKLYVSLALEMKEYAAGLDDAVGRARSFGDRIKGALGGAVATAGVAAVAGLTAVTGAVVGLGASSVGVASEFQSSMAIMSTAVDPVSLGVETSAEAMAIMSDAALAVGSDTALVGVSASSSAEAITGLYKAGLSTAEIFGDLQGYLAGTSELSGALRASIDLAAASELDMVQASDLAAVTLATFGGHLETEAERAEFINAAMNNFVQTADASVASVGDLQAAFVNVGPTASALGMGMGDVNTALGILSTRGITGSEAGTALKSMLTNLMRTTPEVTGTLEELGVSLYDAQGVMYSLPEIIGQLESSMAGMTEEQRNQTVQTLAGTYGMNAMNTLLGEGTAGWAAMEEAVAGAATMQETAAARTNTLAGAQEALSGVWESFKIQVGTALIPVLTLLADVGSTLLERYGPTLVAVFENIGAGIGRIVEVVTGGQLGELFTVFEDGSSVLGSIFEAFGMGEEKANALAASISRLVTAVWEVVGPIVDAVANFVSWKDVLAALGIVILATVVPAIVSMVISMAPILLTVGAIIAVVALLRNAWENNWGDIQGKVQAVWGFLQPIFAAVIEWVGNKIKADLEKLRAFWVDVAWPAIQRVVEVVWPVVERIFQAIGNFITKTLIPTIQDLWQTWTEEVWPTIQTVTENVWTIVEEIFTEIGRWINDNIVPWVEYLREIWVDVVWPAIQRALETAWGVIEPIWEAIRSWAAETLPPVIEDLQTIFETVMSGISAAVEPVKRVWDGFVSAVQGFWDWIKDKVFNFKINLPDLPDWAIPGSPLPIHTAWLAFANDMPGIGEEVAGGIDTIAEAVEELGELLDPVSEIYDGINGLLGFGDKIGGLASGFAGHFERLVTGPMKDRLDELTGVLDTHMPGIAERWEQVTGTMMADWMDPTRSYEVMAQLYRFLRGTTPGSALNESIQASIDAMVERNDLNQEYLQQQERLLALERARADLDFLKQQMELLNLVREHHIPMSVLEGVQLGVAADPGQLMDIMVAVMEQIVRQTSYELGNMSSIPAVTNPTPGTEGATTYNINEQTIHGGQHINVYGVTESELERLSVLGR